MAPEGILSFASEFLRSTSIGIMFRKPGGPSKIELSPQRGFEDLVFAQSRNQLEQISNERLKRILQVKTGALIKDYVKRIKSAI